MTTPNPPLSAESGHVQEPWDLEVFQSGAHVMQDNQRTGSYHVAECLREPDDVRWAARITACLNGCRGIPDPASYLVSMRAEVESQKKAIEFAEYMATAGESLMEKINILSQAVADRIDYEDNDSIQAVEDAEQAMNEAYRGLTNDIFEFRKRAPALPATSGGGS